MLMRAVCLNLFRIRRSPGDTHKHPLIKGNEAASTGFAVGYESASQFDRDYRRLFGQPPGRDASAIRQGATANLEA